MPAPSHCPIPSCKYCASQVFRHSFSPQKDSHPFSCHHSGRAKLGLPGWSPIVLSASCCTKLHALSQEGQVYKCCRRCSLTGGKVCVFQDTVRYIWPSPLACNLQMVVSDHLPCDRQLCFCVSASWPRTAVVCLCDCLSISPLSGHRLAYSCRSVTLGSSGIVRSHFAMLLMTCPDVHADMACMQMAVHLIYYRKGCGWWRYVALLRALGSGRLHHSMSPPTAGEMSMPYLASASLHQYSSRLTAKTTREITAVCTRLESQGNSSVIAQLHCCRQRISDYVHAEAWPALPPCFVSRHAGCGGSEGHFRYPHRHSPQVAVDSLRADGRAACHTCRPPHRCAACRPWPSRCRSSRRRRPCPRRSSRPRPAAPPGSWAGACAGALRRRNSLVKEGVLELRRGPSMKAKDTHPEVGTQPRPHMPTSLTTLSRSSRLLGRRLRGCSAQEQTASALMLRPRPSSSNPP